ncbi:MAG: PspC domain-containing protein [Dermatophilaceae bacterium]|nr:PspC domain-containing protein [Dermatophilaceae bacterium]
MSEQSTSHPETGVDRFFTALRGLGIRRRTDNKWIAGVCSGLADRLRIDPVIVRAALVLLSVLGGAGITVYLVAWALLPNDRDEIVAQRALRDGDGGSIVLIVLAALALFGGSLFTGPWWGGNDGWGFPWGLVFVGLLIWWLVRRSGNQPDADQRVMSQRTGSPGSATPPPRTSGPWPAPSGQSPQTGGATGQQTQVFPQTQVIPRAQVPKRPRRRSGGPLMALIAIGVILATYGSLVWAGNAFTWPGDHHTIAFAGALAAVGLLTFVLGIAGWRAGFVTFLAVVLAITAWSSSVVPTGIQLGGRVGDAIWKPASVSSTANYHLGVGDGVLDLGNLPTEGLSEKLGEARVPAYVGLGELKVIVPEGLTVRVVGHVGLGEILMPGETQNDAGNGGQGGTDVSRSVTVGDGPAEVVVDAGVGIGQLTVVKE